MSHPDAPNPYPDDPDDPFERRELELEQIRTDKNLNLNLRN
jgi:hypothetical protein